MLELVRKMFESFARVRSARAFHPVGITFTGRLVVDAADSGAADALAGEWPVVVRASKGLGTPQDWPDFHGIAVRVEHDVGPVDLLFTTVARHVPYVLAPSTGWDSHPYTTFLPYRTHTGHSVLLRLDPEQEGRAPESGIDSIAEAVRDGSVSFVLSESAGMSWHPIGRLTLEALSDAQIAFDPVVNEHPRFKHDRHLAALRSWAYRGSRRGREAEPGGLAREPVPDLTSKGRTTR